MTSVEQLARDIQAVRTSFILAMRDAMQEGDRVDSTRRVAEVTKLMASLVTQYQMLIPPPANSN